MRMQYRFVPGTKTHHVKSFRPYLVGALIILAVLLPAGCGTQQNATVHQQMVHDTGSQVMPFELSKTVHIFTMSETGGIQQVLIRDRNDSEQLPLIRQHLQREAMRFSMGDFSDPVALHGTDMPGVNELEDGAADIHISYNELPDGGQITYATSDIRLITAIHRWFGAQLSDHGTDATYR